MDRLLFGKPSSLDPLAESSLNIYKPRSRWLRYGTAVGSLLLVAFILQWLRPHEFGRGFLFLTAVVASAWFGGLGPGLFATMLALPLMSIYAQYPLNQLTLTLTDIVLLGVFGLTGIAVSLLEESRRRTEEKLQRSLNQFKVILEGIADGVTAQDVTGKLIYANDTAARVTGFTSARALLDAPIPDVLKKFEVLREDGQPFPLDQLPGRRALQEGRVVQATLRFRILESQEERWSVVKASPVFDAHGNVQMAINLFQDITAHKETEEAVDPERERLRVTLASIGDGVITTDTQGRVEFMNPVAETLTGWPLAEVVGRPVSEVFHIVNEETRAPVENPAARALVEETVIGLANHTVLISRDGTEHPIDDSGAPIRRAGGSPSGAVLIFRDIAERRKAERALQQAHAQTVEILETLGDAFYTLDHEWRFTYVNRKAEEYWERKREDLLGKVIWDVFPQVKGTVPYDAHFRATHERATVAFETISPVLNRWIEARMYPNESGLSVYFHDISERKNVEQALRDNEQQLRLLTDALPVLISYVDAEQRYRFNNKAYEDWFGHRRADITGKLAREVLGEAAYQALQGYFEAALSGQWIHFEAQIPYQGAGERYISATYVPDKADDGKVKGFHALVEDVTPRKHLEIKLQEQEVLFRQVMQNMRQAFCIGDPSLNHVYYVNPAYEVIFGNSAEELYQDARSWMTHVYPDDRAITEGIMNAAPEQELDNEYRIVHSDGNLRWIRERSFPVRNEAGAIVRSAAIAEDITERKLVEEERSRLLAQLEQQSHRLNDLIANVSGVVWESWGSPEPGEGKINFVSDYIVDLLGYPLENWLTIPDFHFSVLHPEDREHYIAQTQAIFASGRPGIVEFRWTAQNGRVVWVASHQMPILDLEGRSMGMRGVTIDVTARKHAEEALRKNEERLRSVLQHMPVMLIATDEEGKCVVWNEECERLTGYGAEEMLDAPNSQLVKRLYPETDYRRRVVEQWERTEGNYRAWELNITAKDGTSRVTVWSDISEEFNVPGWANWAVGVDITARKQAEAAQHETDQRWRMALENMPILLSVNDEEGNRIVWNREAERVTGFTSEEMVNSKVRRALLYPDPDYRAWLVSELDSHYLDFRDVELRTTCKDGSIRIISWSNLSRRCPIPGWPDWALGVDVTERKLAEERLNRLQSVTAALSQALTPQEVANVILSEGGAAVGARAATVTMLVEQGAMLETVHSVGFPPDYIDQWRRFSINAPRPLADAVRTNTPIFISSAEVMQTIYPQTPILNTLGHQAWAAIPFMVDTRVLGGLSFAFDTPRDFSEEERAFILALAQHCAQAFERARLYDTERQSRAEAEAAQKRLAFLAEASALLASSLDYEETLQQMARLAVRSIADWCVIDVLEDDGALHRVAVAHTNPDKQELVQELQDRYPFVRPDQKHTAMKVIRTNLSWFDADVSPIRLAQEARDDEHLRLLTALGFESEIVVSLNAHGKLIGTITLVLGESGRHYNTGDLELAEELARRAAASVDNVRLYRQAQEARADAIGAVARTSRLQAVTAALSQALTTEQISEVIISQGLESLSAFAGSLYRVVGQDLHLVRAVGYSESLLDQWRRFSITTSVPIADAVHTGKPIWLESDQDRIEQYPEIAQSAGQRNGSWAAIPLIVEEHPIGALGLTFATPRRFSQEEKAFALALAQQCAQALERARLYETIEREQKQQTFLAEATAMLASSLDYELTLQSVAFLAVPLVADWCSIHVMNDEGVTIEQLVVAHKDPDKVAWAESLQSRYPADQNAPRGVWNVLRTGQPEYYPTITDELLQEVARDDEHLSLMRQVGFSSAMIVPLVARGRTIGALSFISAESGRQYDPDTDLSLIQELARRAAIAVDNSRLYHQVQQQRRLSEALRSTAIALSGSLNLSEVLDQILVSVKRVVPHDAADIMFLEEGIARIERSTGYVEQGLVETEEEIMQVRLNVNEISNLRWIVQHKQPLAIGDTQTYDGWISVQQSHLIRSCLSAPVLIGGEVIGFINVNSFTPQFFTNQGDTLQTFANQAAVAIRNAWLYQQAQKLAALEERQRLARDLHDAVSQTLFSASVIAESLPRLWERDAGKVQPKLLQLSRLNRGALAEMRTLLLELRPAALLNTSLGDLVTQLAEAIKGRREIAISLDVHDHQPLPPDVHIALYRIIQEALNNIMKHAQASVIQIRVQSKPQQVEVQIKDNGRGFDVPTRSAGLGLGTMHERATAIGAELAISSQVGEGTVVAITWSASRI